MTPLIDLLETSPPVDLQLPGGYDPDRNLRVDGTGRPVVLVPGSGLGTQTRGGADRDDAPPTVTSLTGTVTKNTSDRDEMTSLLVTKTAGGRDTDDDRAIAASVLLGTVTFAGPDRD
ncbi:MAG TPA: hypothetical protein VK701_09100 [Solirubrobacteraceae bacterium]|nr:hypothetical protein [Solirubrobacteraceae bacterium]